MTDQRFFFSIELSPRTSSPDMLRELVSRILAQAGSGSTRAAEVVGALESALTQTGSRGDASCRFTFRAGTDTLEIEAASSSGSLWHSTHQVT